MAGELAVLTKLLIKFPLLQLFQMPQIIVHYAVELHYS